MVNDFLLSKTLLQEQQMIFRDLIDYYCYDKSIPAEGRRYYAPLPFIARLKSAKPINHARTQSKRYKVYQPYTLSFVKMHGSLQFSQYYSARPTYSIGAVERYHTIQLYKNRGKLEGVKL